MRRGDSDTLSEFLAEREAQQRQRIHFRRYVHFADVSGRVSVDENSIDERTRPGTAPFAGCVWVASRCRDLQRSAKLPRKIIQFFEDFDVRERTLNLRVVGSTPTRLTIDSKGLNDIDHPIQRGHNLLVVRSIPTQVTIDSTATTPRPSRLGDVQRRVVEAIDCRAIPSGTPGARRLRRSHG
jgi:hypothetical protein